MECGGIIEPPGVFDRHAPAPPIHIGRSMGDELEHALGRLYDLIEDAEQGIDQAVIEIESAKKALTEAKDIAASWQIKTRYEKANG